ncbi:hypothetical protein KCU95_g4, partial [Aureobasidium melanogenum]
LVFVSRGIAAILLGRYVYCTNLTRPRVAEHPEVQAALRSQIWRSNHVLLIIALMHDSNVTNDCIKLIGGSKIGQKRHGLKSMTSTERSEPAQLLSDRKERGVHLMTTLSRADEGKSTQHLFGLDP